MVDRKRNQDIPMYKLKDYNNEVIKSLFYEPELQLAYMDSNAIVPEVLVKWKG